MISPPCSASGLGAAHLFIDDCAARFLTCSNTTIPNDSGTQVNASFCYVNGCCQPCTDGSDPHSYWAARCQAAEPAFRMNGDGGCEDDGENHCTVGAWDT
jgi:hypothetical protein